MRTFARRDPTDSMPAALRVTGLGHFDPFPPPRLKGRCGFGEGTFAKTRGNGEDAPIPVIRGSDAETSEFDPVTDFPTGDASDPATSR
jgi:hypothetical protein